MDYAARLARRYRLCQRPKWFRIGPKQAAQEHLVHAERKFVLCGGLIKHC